MSSTCDLAREHGLERLSPTEAAQLCDELLARYADEGEWRLAFWEELQAPSSATACPPEDRASLLEELLTGDDEAIFLAIADEEPPTWPAWTGPLEGLIALIASESPREAFLCNQGLDWLVALTPIDRILTAGGLYEQGEEEWT